jgi:hypothetical protein
MQAGDRPKAKPQPRTADKPMDENMFAGASGQSLLLVLDSHKNKEASAILIPVFRPSVEWARRMAAIEQKQKPLPVKAPETSDPSIERWRHFRWLHCGEDEVEVWERIRRQCLAQQPKWYRFLSFWKPVSVEERNASTPSNNRDSQLILVSCSYIAEKAPFTESRSSQRSTYKKRGRRRI